MRQYRASPIARFPTMSMANPMLTMKGLAMLAALSLATENHCRAGDESCVATDSSNGRSMLNLGVRMRSKMDVTEQALAVRKSPISREENLMNFSDSTIITALSHKPKPDTSGLPGNVVITTVTLKCGEQVFAPLGQCPDACPYFTSLSDKKKSCYFVCVAADKCGSETPEERVPDKDEGVCRPCNVQGCATCAPGQEDICGKCADGYHLEAEGTCTSDAWAIWKYILGFVAVLMGFLVIWLIQLACAPITNRDGLEEGLTHRSSTKLHIPIKDEADPSEDRELWPISTNLHVQEVAGPGLLLHMNFQLASIIWANTLIVCWLCFAYMTDVQQLTIGLLPADTPPQLCYVTLAGRAQQERDMPFKVAFIAIVYVITFFGTIAYALINQRAFDSIHDESGMEDFALLLHGLPAIKGSDRGVEAELKECLQKNTGEKVVGISIAWDYGAQEDEIQDILEKDLISRDPFEQPVPDPNVYDSRGPVQQKIFGPVDKLVGGVLGLTIPDGDDDDSIDEKKVVEMLENISTTNSAFVVFETEEARDRAYETMKGKDVVAFRGGTLKLQRKFIEPKAVLWENFNVHFSQMVTRVAIGICGILVALVVYSLCFYLPFAYYQSMFKFPNEPGFVEGFIFSMLVVAGNQIMYQICALISDGAGFHFRDSAETLYVLLYVMAVLLSVIFDMSVEFYLGYHSMADAHVKTADGRSLDTLTSWQEIFESYPMQKVLGKRLFDYCFPATFTIPFLVEPMGTILAPFTIQKLLLRTHPEVRGRNAEKSVAAFAPMDLGRYGDILLNIWLVTMILFFPSGSILPILLTYVVSHLYIYCYDQYRILRCVPSFDYGSNDVDKYTQLMMIFPCSTLAACLVFKANCISEGFCFQGYSVLYVVVGAAVAHALLHLLCLKVIVPVIGSLHQHKIDKQTYAEVASKDACNWFNANPIHCLRSTFIHKDSPSCCYWVQGKEHLMRKNAEIGLFFENLKKTRSEWLEDFAAMKRAKA